LHLGVLANTVPKYYLVDGGLYIKMMDFGRTFDGPA
jgi:hypothetical protein